MTRVQKFKHLLSSSAVPAALVVTIATVAGAAHAQVAVTAVTSPSLDATQESSLAKQIAEYAEQAKRWADTLKQYQQFISTISGFSFQSLLPQQQLQKMDEQKMVQMACPGSGNIIADVFSAVTSINLNGPIVENANNLCAMTTTIKVKMYNETVDKANRITDYTSQITKITDLIGKLLGSLSSAGDTQKLTLEATKLQTQLDQEMQAYDTKIRGYQSMLLTLKDAQSILASISLRGAPSTLGTVVQAGTFAAAFSK